MMAPITRHAGWDGPTRDPYESLDKRWELGCLVGRGGLILPAPESGDLGHPPGVCRSSWQCLTPSSRWMPAAEQDNQAANRS